MHMQQGESKLLDRVRLELNPCRRNSNKAESMFVICSFETVTDRCLEVTVRTALQVENLVQHVTERHGGHLIPVLELYGLFTKGQTSQDQIYPRIAEYLNDLIKNPHCKMDPKLYEFIFQQEVVFPNLERYDKVLSDAAMMSRRYLNTIFTRKQYGEVHVEDKDMLATFEEFKLFATSFRATREIMGISARQHSLLEDILSGFREIRGGLGRGVPPTEFIPNGMNSKLHKMDKLITQGEQAYARWEVLRETVRQLQCNIFKGLHEEQAYYMEKTTQLKNWTCSLITDLKALTQRGNAGIAEYSKYLYVCRQEQSEWFGRTGKGKGREEEEEEDIFADEKEWNPMEQFKHNKEEWSVHKVAEG